MYWDAKNSIQTQGELHFSHLFMQFPRPVVLTGLLGGIALLPQIIYFFLQRAFFNSRYVIPSLFYKFYIPNFEIRFQIPNSLIEKGLGQMAKSFYINMELRGLRQSQSSAG